jgi:hypothetical protein
VWLYLLHPKSFIFDLHRAPRLGAPADGPDVWSKRFSHYSAKGLVPTPGLCVCPFLAGMAKPAAVDTVAQIVSAYLQTWSVVDYSPEIGYTASLFATYMDQGRAFTAFWRLMETRGLAHLFIGNGVKQFTAVWDGLLTAKAPELRGRFRDLGISHADYLLPWARGAFLTVPFLGALALAIFDRVVDRGLRALLEVALMVVISMRRKLVSASREKVLEMLANPAKDPVFADCKTVLARLNRFFVPKKAFEKTARPGKAAKKKRGKNGAFSDDSSNRIVL